MFLSLAAWAALLTTPGPQSTTYEVLFTTIASEGPDRSGLAKGVPVPNKINWVLGTLSCAAS